MNAAHTASSRHLLTPEELGACVAVFRAVRRWSQEHLAAIAGLSVHTVQRVEDGEPVSLDTRRSIARAFELEDIDR